MSFYSPTSCKLILCKATRFNDGTGTAGGGTTGSMFCCTDFTAVLILDGMIPAVLTDTTVLGLGF